MFRPFSLNLRGRLVEFDRPAVMAIVNATPDSFFAGSRARAAADVRARTERLLAEGADIIDLGAYSTRPGADAVTEQEELARLLPALEAVRQVSADIPVSVDTFRASVAREAVAHGADIVNDISGGTLDPDMFPTVAALEVPYVLMHMRGTPATMQQLTDYPDGVTVEVLRFLAERAQQLTDMGCNDVILDPGFGFAKTVEQNWTLLRELPALGVLDRPVLVGLSRKSMLTKPLGIAPSDALPATVAANVLALQGGASILRVHDPAAARQSIAVTLQ